MLDHISLHVRDLAASVKFYVAALEPLGAGVVFFQNEQTAGIGPRHKPQLWLHPAQDVQPVHLAFSARDRDEVRRFYDAALAAGATDNGPPGPRPQYHRGYYGAFVRDPSGHNIEAVCHTPEE